MVWSLPSSPTLPCSSIPHPHPPYSFPTWVAISLSPCFFLSPAVTCKLRESWACSVLITSSCPEPRSVPGMSGMATQPLCGMNCFKSQCTCPLHFEFHPLLLVTVQELRGRRRGLSGQISLLVVGCGCLLLSLCVCGGAFLKSQSSLTALHLDLRALTWLSVLLLEHEWHLVGRRLHAVCRLWPVTVGDCVPGRGPVFRSGVRWVSGGHRHSLCPLPRVSPSS